jgi:AraC family transcriptional regulator, transcriptional activator of pobA
MLITSITLSRKSPASKSTTTLITDRMIHEEKALLKNINWSVAEIAYALGFEYPTYFNNFFKKKTRANS